MPHGLVQGTTPLWPINMALSLAQSPTYPSTSPHLSRVSRTRTRKSTMMRLLPVAFVALATLAPVRAVPVDPDCSGAKSSIMATPTPTMSVSATMAGPSSTASGGVPSATSSAGGAINLVATTWYASWHAQYLTPEAFPWDKYTAVGYSFAYVFLFSIWSYNTYGILSETTPDPTTVTITDSENFVPFIEAAHKNVSGQRNILMGQNC